MNPKCNEFIENLGYLKEQGYNVWGCFTQAWHETGGFKSVIGNYNYWGIKKPKNWESLTINVNTHEWINGKNEPVIDVFIDFYNVTEALKWWDSLIKRLYFRAFENRDNPELFFIDLVSGKYKWATDPQYSKKLTELYKLLKWNSEILFKIDSMGV